jgi:hypothetical protein
MNACVLACLVALDSPLVLHAQVPPPKPFTKESPVIYLGGLSFLGDLGAERVPPVRIGGPSSVCLGDSGWVAEARLGKLREIGSSNDSTFVMLRERLGQLPRVSADSIRLVADSALCRAASRAVGAIYDWAKDQPLHLARTGPWFVAFPATVRMGEYGLAVYLDRRLTPVGLSVW